MDCIDNRHIRLFISSTFQDMQDERDYLMKKTFPKLRQIASERDVMLTELDLRWGITEEEAKSGKVVEICLREIENSIPFFIGIIGNRYGWIPNETDLSPSALQRFSDIKRYVQCGLSVTEMEMQFGVLERPEDMHAFFYIKEQFAESDNPDMLEKLKTAVVSNKRYPVSHYKSANDLSLQIEQAFLNLLDQLFPQEALSIDDKEFIGQKAFMNQLCQDYIRVQKHFDALDVWLENDSQIHYIVTGASGLGKSALLANWCREKVSSSDSKYQIIYHSIGNGGGIASSGHIVNYLCSQIQRLYGINPGTSYSNSDSRQLLESLFSQVSEQGRPLLIVLDAINQIEDSGHGKLLDWLPAPGRNIKILLSTVDGDKTMDIFRARRYPIYTLLELDKADRKALIVSYLRRFSKSLSDNVIDRIVNDKQCKNTRVLKTLLEELINFGVYEELDSFIDYYLQKNSQEEFYQAYLEKYEADYSEYGPDFIKQILSYIITSRAGLSENELKCLAKASSISWSQFYCSFRPNLVIRDGRLSFSHSFISDAIQKRYLNTSEEWEKKCRRDILLICQKNESNWAIAEKAYQYYVLKDYDSLYNTILSIASFEYLRQNFLPDITRYWKTLLELKKGYSLYSYYPVIDCLAKKDKVRAVAFMLKMSSFSRENLSGPELSVDIAKYALHYVGEGDNYELAEINNELCLSYHFAGNYHLALECVQKAIRINEKRSASSEDLAANYCNACGMLGRLGKYQEAIEYGEKAISIYNDRQIAPNDNYAACLFTLGARYGEIGNHERALDLFFSALNIRLNIYGTKHPYIAHIYNDIGVSYSGIGDTKNALKYELMALGIRRELYGDCHPDIASSLIFLGDEYIKAGDFQKAEDCYQESMHIRNMIFGNNHPDTATVMDSLCNLYLNQSKYTDALKYGKMALEIREQTIGHHHEKTAYSYNRVGEAFMKLGDSQEGLKHKKEAVAILEKSSDKEKDLAYLINRLTLDYTRLHDYSNAISFAERNIALRKKIYSKDSLELANAYKNIGYLYGEMEDYQKELEYQFMALEIMVKLYGDNSEEAATSYRNIAYAYCYLNKYEESLDYNLKDLAIRKLLNTSTL